MDAITYLKVKDKITDNCKINCGICPFDTDTTTCLDTTEPETAVEIVEKWLAEHPPVTYASKMREVFPKFVASGSNCLAAALDKACSEIKCCDQDGCKACWNREYGSLEK
jgi:hypothetical protein